MKGKWPSGQWAVIYILAPLSLKKKFNSIYHACCIYFSEAVLPGEQSSKGTEQNKIHLVGTYELNGN